ncbi:MAG: DoxX family protein [Mastigocoleus sp. MO_167.B18]|uniref:DoxX family protein n=1 Tax=Mastigocoleus sp. MO_188.B34 TaxID=3036635 RepID=UPI0026384A37|nr:DoxX family protein [Mastigocoleus sp. MO_188.B34]MDJ0693304.1 DoxX family protein [Mastigocoleus sp. MO_188.B34]MDJ0774422.1 DoxX family protein [Mastigocoleus sp. MO_167.B18]
MGFKKYLPLLGRAFLAAIFLNSGVGHIFGFAGLTKMMSERGLPVAPLLLAGSIFCLLVGGLSILFGFKARWGAILLIIFLIPASLVFHNPIADPSELNNFLKNIGLMGGMLFIYYFGSGPVSIDSGESSQPQAYVSQSE